MARWGRWGLAGVLAAGLVIAVAQGVLAAGEEKLAAELTRLMQTGRKIISDNQALINDPSKGDKGFTPLAFTDQVIAEYAKSTGTDLHHPTGDDGKWLALMIEAQRDTVAEAQPIINTPGMGFKGFIPAAFVRKAGEKFTAKSGLTMKFTATEFRNARNEPDSFEKKVFTLFASSTYPKGKAYAEVLEVGGKKVYRIMFPEYAAKSCLSCHGEPRGDRDITGGKKEGQKEGDLAGALSWTIPVK